MEEITLALLIEGALSRFERLASVGHVSCMGTTGSP